MEFAHADGHDDDHGDGDDHHHNRCRRPSKVPVPSELVN